MRSPTWLSRAALAMASLCLVALTACMGVRRRDASLAGAETAVAEVTLHQESAEVLLEVMITVPGRAAGEVVGVRLDTWGGSDRGQLSSATVNGAPTDVDADGTIRFGSRPGSRQVVRYRLQVHPEQRSPEYIANRKPTRVSAVGGSRVRPRATSRRLSRGVRSRAIIRYQLGRDCAEDR